MLCWEQKLTINKSFRVCVRIYHWLFCHSTDPSMREWNDARRTMKEGSNSGRATLYPGKSMSTQVQHSAWVTVSWVNALRERERRRERDPREERFVWGSETPRYIPRELAWCRFLRRHHWLMRFRRVCIQFPSSSHRRFQPRFMDGKRGAAKESKVEETSIRCNFFFSFLSSGQLLLFHVRISN